jgi:hypothetical protein
MPCHCTIDYEDPDWRKTQLPNAPLCVGGLIFMRNVAKLPRDPVLRAAMEEVPRYSKVFATSQAFLQHHNRKDNDD